MFITSREKGKAYQKAKQKKKTKRDNRSKIQAALVTF